MVPALIRKFIEASKDNLSEVEVWGTGKPLREFLYVDDLSSAIEFVISNNIDNDLLNVGSGEEISIKELSRKIKNLIKFEGTLEFDNTKPDGNPRKLLDSTLINNLGWRSNINLDEGLELTFQWFEKNYKSLRK